jgi:O-methyltransferase
LARFDHDVPPRPFPYVAEDGIMIADGCPDWDGYARAIHEYLAGYEGMARIKQFEGGLYYVVKGERNWATAYAK